MPNASRYAILLLSSLLMSCTTGVDPSPSPGIVRVMLRANQLDTTLIIQNDTSRFSRWDTFNLYVSQGRIYKGDNYAPLYRGVGLDRLPGDTVNIIAREWLDGRPVTLADAETITPANSRYRQYKVFESYIPPGTYEKIQFAVLANEVVIYVPKNYQNPVQLPPDAPLVVEFTQPITVNENGVTQINVEISPFKSLQRYRDSFLFNRKMQIVNIQNM